MPATNTLSDKTIKAALKTAKEGGGPKTLKDGGGFSLLVQASGAGWWRLRYWIDGRENRLSLGTYSEIKLREARERRDASKKLIAAGTDPSEARKAGKAERGRQREKQALADAGLPGPGTFEHVAREWLVTVHAVKVSLAILNAPAFAWSRTPSRGWVGVRSPRLTRPSCCNACGA